MRAFFYPLIASGLLIAGCATEEQKPAASAPVEQAKPAAKPQAVESKPVTRVDTGKPSASPFAMLKDPNNILSKRQVYFDFDKFDVKDEYKALVEAHAPYLRETISDMITRGGFPAVILAPLSFEALYLQQQQNAAPTQLGPRIEVARN